MFLHPKIISEKNHSVNGYGFAIENFPPIFSPDGDIREQGNVVI